MIYDIEHYSDSKERESKFEVPGFVPWFLLGLSTVMFAVANYIGAYSTVSHTAQY